LGVQKIPNISIVDDNEAVREATKGLVRSLGYDASAFSSAGEFLASGHVHDTSCLITDLHMPELSGTDLQSRLIADGHRMPIIFITAYPEDSARERAMKAGAIAFIGKPFSEDRLIGCLERALKIGNAEPTEC
jgi:FixJ family two-component response regulator